MAAVTTAPKSGLLWGAVLAGVSSIPFFIVFFSFLRTLSPAKATGLAAVAGDWTEAYTTFGLILTIVLPVVAIVLLSRSFSKGNLTHKMFSLLSIVWSSFILLVYGVVAWFVLVEFPRMASRH
jgi:hypothetical protein